MTYWFSDKMCIVKPMLFTLAELVKKLDLKPLYQNDLL